MLVLSRKSGEEIVLGDDIRVRVLKVDKGRVRLGISAPSVVTVRRQELCRKFADESASRLGDGTLLDKQPNVLESVDIDLQQRVRNVLVSHNVAGAEQLSVKAVAGDVTLSGRLPSLREKRLCIECSSHVAGVRRVVDKLIAPGAHNAMRNSQDGETRH